MPEASSVRVLIVDDQKSARMLARDSLRVLGLVQVRECADGREAMEDIANYPPHLIISDMSMPNMSGLDLLQAVRGNAEASKTAFIMLTGHGEQEMVKKAIQLGVNNYIRKPFTAADLKRKIEAVLGPLTR